MASTSMRSSIISKAKKIKKEIQKHTKGQILIHTNPDGDAVASAVGLFRTIRQLNGRNFHLFCPKPIPQRYQFLPHTSRFKTKLTETNFAIVLDTGSLGRLPGWKTEGKLTINIDHHDSNPLFGNINIVKPKASSTVEILMELFDIWKVEIDTVTANALYAGIYFETGGFIFRNTTADSFIKTGKLVKHGASPYKISKQIFGQSESRIKLLSMVLSTLKTKDGIATTFASQEMFKKTKTKPEDTEGFVEIPLTIYDVKISILLKELEGGRTKASLRSKGRINVNRIAQQFGGGGHRNAAGFIINRALKQARRIIINKIKF